MRRFGVHFFTSGGHQDVLRYNDKWLQASRNVRVETPSSVSCLNRFLSWFYRTDAMSLFLVSALIYFTNALILATLALPSLLDCAAQSDFISTFFLSLCYFANGNPMMRSVESLSRGCLILQTVAGYVSLVIQIMLFSALTVRMLSPQNELVFTPDLIVTARDDKNVLQFRFVHPQGHFLAGISISAWWTNRVGKQLRTFEISFTVPSAHQIPLTASHELSETSPLYEYRSNMEATPGFLTVIVYAFDTRFKTPVNSRHVFLFVEDFKKCACFMDAIKVSIPEAIACDQSPEVDMRAVFQTRVHI